MADEASLKETALITQFDPASAIKSRIARMRARITRWDREAGGVETWWVGGSAYRQFCEGMARAAREKESELETALGPLVVRHS
jgi:hypothetical protein